MTTVYHCDHLWWCIYSSCSSTTLRHLVQLVLLSSAHLLCSLVSTASSTSTTPSARPLIFSECTVQRSGLEGSNKRAVKMMNTAYFDHGSTANGFYNSAEAHQAYRSFSQSALSLMPSAATVASAAYANSSSNLRTGQSSVNIGSVGADGVGGGGGGNGSSNYVDAACKLYGQESGQVSASQAAAAAAAAAFKSECSQLSNVNKSDQNGFKAPSEHQMNASAWQSSLRPSPSSTSMSGPDMRSFDAAAAAACSRSVSDAWSACCNNPNMNAPMGGSNAFYPWMAIAGLFIIFFIYFNFLFGFSKATVASNVIVFHDLFCRPFSLN